MPSIQAMEQVTRLCGQVEELQKEFVRIQKIPDVTKLDYATPLFIEGLIDIMKTLTIHVKQLQLEVQRIERRIENIPGQSTR